jgi:hypothetical protein
VAKQDRPKMIEPVDSMSPYLAQPPGKPPPKPRKRDWERNNPGVKFRIRGATHHALKDIAAGEGLTLDMLADYALSDFVRRYRSGEVHIEKRAATQYVIVPPEIE